MNRLPSQPPSRGAGDRRVHVRLVPPREAGSRKASTCRSHQGRRGRSTSSQGLASITVRPARRRSTCLATRRLCREMGRRQDPDDFLATDGDDKSNLHAGSRQVSAIRLLRHEEDTTKEANRHLRRRAAGPGKAYSAPTPVAEDCTAEDELHPWVTADGKELYFQSQDGGRLGGDWRVFVAPRPNPLARSAATPKLIEELPAGFHHRHVNADGKTMYLKVRSTRAASASSRRRDEHRLGHTGAGRTAQPSRRQPATLPIDARWHAPVLRVGSAPLDKAASTSGPSSQGSQEEVIAPLAIREADSRCWLVRSLPRRGCIPEHRSRTRAPWRS